MGSVEQPLSGLRRHGFAKLSQEGNRCRGRGCGAHGHFGFICIGAIFGAQSRDAPDKSRRIGQVQSKVFVETLGQKAVVNRAPIRTGIGGIAPILTAAGIDMGRERACGTWSEAIRRKAGPATCETGGVDKVQIGTVPELVQKRAGLRLGKGGAEGQHAFESEDRVVQIGLTRAVGNASIVIKLALKKRCYPGCGFPQETGRQSRDL